MKQYKIFSGLSFYLKVNGVPIFAKGTNYIPANIFPEKMNSDSVVLNLLTSAKKVYVNTIRVWGGGVYESDEFYEVLPNCYLFGLFHKIKIKCVEVNLQLFS